MKQFSVLMRLDPSIKSGVKNPFEIEEVVFAKDRHEAKKILEARYKNRRAFFIKDITPSSSRNGAVKTESAGRENSKSVRSRRRHTSTEDSDDVDTYESSKGSVNAHAKVIPVSERRNPGSGCRRVAMFGLMLIGLWVVIRYVDFGGGARAVHQGATSGIPDAERGREQTVLQPQLPAPLLTVMPADDDLDEGGSSIGIDQSSPAVEGINALFPFRAVIVDRRRSVVLQSEPRMLSRNVAKIPAGIVVAAQTDAGKWIKIRTDDGRTGYVRGKQLQFLSNTQ